MSDDKKPDGTPKTPEGGEGQKSNEKVWSDEEVKKIIAERDKAKDKLRKVDEEEKKAAEQKAIAEGQMKEVLESTKKELEEAKKKAAAYEEQQTRLREAKLSEIKDEELKKIAGGLSLDALEVFVKKINNESVSPFSDKGKPKPEEGSPNRPRPGESYMEWNQRLTRMGKK